MLKVKKVTRRLKEFKCIKSLYKRAFPKIERKPIWSLLSRSRRKDVDFIAFYDDNAFCGFTYLIHGTNITFVVYLATDDNIRSKGYGSRMLKWIGENRRSFGVVLNIEAIIPSLNYDQRVRRANFCHRNNYSKTGYTALNKNQPYTIMHKGKGFNKQEYEKLLSKFYGNSNITLVSDN